MSTYMRVYPCIFGSIHSLIHTYACTYTRTHTHTHTTQHNTTQRNATQRNATQRNTTQHNTHTHMRVQLQVYDDDLHSPVLFAIFWQSHLRMKPQRLQLRLRHPRHSILKPMPNTLYPWASIFLPEVPRASRAQGMFQTPFQGSSPRPRP